MGKAAQAGELALSPWNLPTPEGLIEKKDIKFCTNGDKFLTLDLFTPSGLVKPVPGIVFIHGGGWGSMTKDDIRHFAIGCAQMGYVTTTINYRLLQEAPFPAQVQDAKCAVRWMRAYADELNVRPESIAVGGLSAGGHLALLVGYTPEVKEFEGAGGYAGTSSRVQVVLDVYGPTNLAAPYFRDNGAIVALIGKSYQDDPKAFVRASPLSYVTEDVPPTLILHGTTDTIVPVSESDQLAAKLKECGVPYLYDRLDGWPHGMDLSTAVRDRCLHFMKAFLDRYLPIE